MTKVSSATVRLVLKKLKARSPDTISTYIHQLQGDKEVADAVKDLPI